MFLECSVIEPLCFMLLRITYTVLDSTNAIYHFGRMEKKESKVPSASQLIARRPARVLEVANHRDNLDTWKHGQLVARILVPEHLLSMADHL